MWRTSIGGAATDDVFPFGSRVAEGITATCVAADEHHVWIGRICGERTVKEPLGAGVDRWRRNAEARPAAALIGRAENTAQPATRVNDISVDDVIPIGIMDGEQDSKRCR